MNNYKIIYTNGWFRYQKRYLQEYSEKEAENLYNRRQPFSIVIEKEDEPFCFINFNNKFVYTGFLDELKREYLGYEFWEEKEGKIFLKEVQFWEFEGDLDNRLTSTRYRFTPEGENGIEEKNSKTREAIRKYAKYKIDTTSLWENYPEFNQYNDIINIEREIPNII